MKGFELGGAAVAKPGVAAQRVVEALDPLEGRRGQFRSGVPLAAVQELALHGPHNDSIIVSTGEVTRPIDPSSPASSTL